MERTRRRRALPARAQGRRRPERPRAEPPEEAPRRPRGRAGQLRLLKGEHGRLRPDHGHLHRRAGEEARRRVWRRRRHGGAAVGAAGGAAGGGRSGRGRQRRLLREHGGERQVVVLLLRVQSSGGSRVSFLISQPTGHRRDRCRCDENCYKEVRMCSRWDRLAGERRACSSVMSISSTGSSFSSVTFWTCRRRVVNTRADAY